MGLLVKIALWTVGIPLGLGIIVLVGILVYKMAKKIDWDHFADSLMNRIKSWWSSNGNFWSKRKDWVVLVALAVVATIFLVGKIRSATTVVTSWNWAKIGLILLGLAVLAGVIYFSYKKYQETKNDPNKGKKLWKFLRWPVGIIAGGLLIFFGVPWVWRNAGPAFDVLLAFGGPSTPSVEARVAQVTALCNAEEEASSVRYSKIARTDAPTVDTIPQGWNLQKWAEEDKLEREFSRSGPFLIETNKVKDGADNIRIAFRLHKIVCASE